MNCFQIRAKKLDKYNIHRIITIILGCNKVEKDSVFKSTCGN